MMRSGLFSTSIVLGVSIFFVACSVHTIGKVSAPQTGDNSTKNGNANSPLPEIKMANIKYPMAIIYEGGTGDPGLDGAGTHKAMWRLYICLKNTNAEASGSIQLDLAKLGHAIEAKTQSSTGEYLFTQELSTLTLNYKYRAELVKNPNGRSDMGYGEGAYSATSVQDWAVVDRAPGVTPFKHVPGLVEDFFNFQVGAGTLAEFNTYDFTADEIKYYISTGMDRFAYNGEENSINVIEACEKNDKPYFFQLGSDLDSK